ncbi:hypothetical protein [Sphingomicrobium arenosum]|uniref:hypothetical protein n=1 Tax=Sphingomicrobium arenosum TaxID=2233861 RepID=UPI00223F271C|nr:hypothetical protein [Sphingomicrobium arenosum]
MMKVAFGSMAALAAMAVASPAMAADEHPTAQQVAESIAACQLITDTDWIHLDRLASLGYDQARRRAGGRRSGASVTGLYQKRGNPSSIITMRDQLKEKSCVVSASLPDTAAYGVLAQELSAIIGMPVGQEGYSYVWQLDDHRLVVQPEGEQDAPFARFTMTKTGEDNVPAAVEPAAE